MNYVYSGLYSDLEERSSCVTEVLYLLDKIEYIMIPIRFYKNTMVTTVPKQMYTIYLGQIRSAAAAGKYFCRDDIVKLYGYDAMPSEINFLVDAQSFIRNMCLDEDFFERMYCIFERSYQPLLRPKNEKDKDGAYFSKKRDMLIAMQNLLPKEQDFRYRILNLSQVKQLMWMWAKCEIMADDPYDGDRDGYKLRDSVDPSYKFTTDYHKLHRIMGGRGLLDLISWAQLRGMLLVMGLSSNARMNETYIRESMRKYMNNTSATTFEGLVSKVKMDSISFYLFESFELWQYIVDQMTGDFCV